MKSILKKIVASVGMATFFFNSALAQNSFFDQATSLPNAATQTALPQSITTIINYFLGLLGLIAVAFLIYSGILMVTAGGNDEQVGKAKKIITFALVGIIIIILSYTIVTFVSSALV